MRAASGFSIDKMEHRRLPVVGSVAGWVLNTGKSRLTGNVLKEPDYQRFPDSDEYCFLICVPINTVKGIEGVLTIDGRNENAFDPQDQLVAELYAGLAGLYLGLLSRGEA